MWLRILLCFLLGFVYASHQPAWKENTEYVYQVRGRILTSLNQISNDYAGIFLKAQLSMKPRSDGNLDAQISQFQYAQIHSELKDGWKTYIPDSELNYKELEFSSEPFQIMMNNGAISDLIVSKEISNLEANVIKSIVSQFQLDTKAENFIQSHINILTQDGSNTAVYKTMEETVTGVSETLYEIHPLPEYILQTEPWLVPLRHLKGDGEISEVVKSKNFTYSEERPAYHFGFDGVEDFNLNNKIGDFFSRNSVSRAVITGTLKRYTIQSLLTVDQIYMSPTLDSKQRGSVNTMINVTLMSIQQHSQQDNEIRSPVAVGLVYRFNSPYSSSNEPRPGQQYDHQYNTGSAEAEYIASQEQYKFGPKAKLSNLLSGVSLDSSSSGSSYSVEDKNWQQTRPKLNQAPESPLLPFTIGFDGQSIKKKQNVVENARKLAQKIAQELQQIEDIPQQNTVGKFVVLTSLLRVMDQNEMLQFASQLYTQQNDGLEADAWKVCRDAVAQTGTGPALLVIQDWIKTNKFEPKDAADIISVAASAARQPTVEYMETFYKVIRSNEVMAEAPLNESALLSYSSLVHQLYVDKDDAHDKYPVYSFGPFNTEEGRTFVKERLIPDLTQKLHEAVSNADTRNIHLYIRVLGNVGHRRILEAFEPYLEGQKQASQFQRLLMVVALDKLATSNPKVARSVLYKIYQNPNEEEQVRVAAVCQLFKTNPSASMLQRMASYTNVDPNEYVNAAVKSAIESASESEEPEYSQLRVAAQSAKPLLTSQQYGIDYSHQKLRSFVVKHLQQSYKQNIHSVGSYDFFWPKGLKYDLRSKVGGVKQEVLNIQAMVSSLDDLFSVLQQQTGQYQQQKRQKQAQNSAQYKFSSEYVAKFLNMENKQREQLEGNWYLQLGNWQQIFSFDNQTIENFPEVVRQLEEELRNGKSVDYTKMLIQNEAALSFPTAIGLPFIYTYDRPVLLKVEGKIKATANPHVYSQDLLSKPDSISSEFEIRALISGKTQSQFGFFSPFDYQRYSAGYDKNFQVMVPISGNIQNDLQNNQLRVELEKLDANQKVNLLQYSTVPYTAKNDIYNPQFEKKIISKKYPQQVDRVFGLKSTGIAFKVQMYSEQPIDSAFVYEKLYQRDVVSALLSPWLDENIQHTKISVGIDDSKSPTKKITVELGWQQDVNGARRKGSSMTSSADISRFDEIPDESLRRQKEFMRRASADVNSAISHVIGGSVEFNGISPIKYSAVVAGSKSNVDPKGRLLVQFKKHGRQGQPLNFYMSAKSHFPNTNGLDMNYAMQMDSTSSIQIQAAFGESYQKSAKINAQIKLSKSKERKEYLTEQPEYSECQQQMQEENQQLPACAKMTAKANLLNHLEANIAYEHLDPRVVNQTYKLYSLLRHVLYPKLEEDIISPQSVNNGLNVEAEFYPDLKAVNFSIDSEYGRVSARNVEVNEWVSTLLVPHPLYHIRSRMMGHIFKYDTYRPTCVVDKNAVNTFDNTTYQLSLGQEWTVVLQYVPRTPSSSSSQPEVPVLQQLNEQRDSYVILVRTSPQQPSQKEVKIVIQNTQTQGKVVEVTLKPAGSSQFPRLFIGNEEIIYNQDSSSNNYDYMEVYPLPNNEIKVEIYEAFYVIYDGDRASFTVVDSQFKDAARGLCGTFTGEEETDFLSPTNCIVKTPEEFVSSYTLSEGQMRPSQTQGECYQKNVVYVNVISSQDIGRVRSEDKRVRNRSSCTMHQTQYVVQGDETCFTLRRLPVCKTGCQQRGNISKKIPVHCVQSTSATNLWRSQIDRGNSPDFSLKTQTRKIIMEVPTRCSP